MKKPRLPPRFFRRNFDRANHTLRHWRDRPRDIIPHRVQVGIDTNGEAIYETHTQEIVR